MIADPFDPYTLLAALERNHVTYIIIGGLARVIHGCDETTHDLDVCPSTRPENLRRLEAALRDLDAREQRVDDPAVREYTTDAGRLSIIEAPTGIDRGYDGLRRQAVREPLGHGLRVQVADIPDLIRNLEHLSRELDTSHAQHLRETVALERSLGLGRGFGMDL